MENVITDAKIEIELLSPKPGDYMVFYVEVGKMRPKQVAEYMSRVVEDLGDEVDIDGVKKIFLPRSSDDSRARTEVKHMTIERLREEIDATTKIREKYDPTSVQ